MRRVALGALCAFVVGGCGSGTAESSPAGDADDGQAIRELITQVELERHPNLCEEAMTEDFVNQEYPPPGDGALDACRYRATHRVDPKRLEFSSVEVDGDFAHASYEVSGNGLGGTRSTVRLIREGESWLLDEYTDMEITDRDLFEVSLITVLTKGGGPLLEPQARCMAEASREVSEERLERLRVRPGYQLPIALVRGCVGDGTAAGAAAEIVRLRLAEKPEYSSYAGCVARYVARNMSTADAVALLRTEDRDTIVRLTKEGLLGCGYIPSDDESVV